MRTVLDLLFPPQCAGCNALGAGICGACAPRGETIRICFPSLRVTAFGPYEGTLRAAVLAVKDGRRDVAEALGQIVAGLVEVPALQFGLLSLVGTVLYVVAFSLIGYELGSTWHSVSHAVSIGGYVIVVLVVLAIAGFVAYRLREVRKESAAREVRGPNA